MNAVRVTGTLVYSILTGDLFATLSALTPLEPLAFAHHKNFERFSHDFSAFSMANACVCTLISLTNYGTEECSFFSCLSWFMWITQYFQGEKSCFCSCFCDCTYIVVLWINESLMNLHRKNRLLRTPNCWQMRIIPEKKKLGYMHKLPNYKNNGQTK